MNVSVLGIGAAGEVTARLLMDLPGVGKLRLVDKREQRLREVRARAARSVETLRADLVRTAEVRKACRGADIVVNASMPAYNLRVMREALRVGAHYVDLASEGSPDPEAPSHVHEQIAMDAAFRRADRTAILGMGVAPGLTNLLARHGTESMRKVDSIRIRVYGSGYAEVGQHPLAPLFSPETFLQEVLYHAPVWDRGRVRRLPPFSGEEDFRFPEPLGVGVCYNVNNEECETMPKFVRDGIGFIDFKYAIAPRRKLLLENLYRLGLTGTAPVSVKGVRVAPLDLLLSLLPDPSSLAGKAVGHTCVVVEVEGQNDGGRRVGKRLWTIMDHGDAYRRMQVHATAFLTGAPPAAAVDALIRGEVRRRGVTTAGGLAAAPILRRAADQGVPLFEGGLGAVRGAPIVR